MTCRYNRDPAHLPIIDAISYETACALGEIRVASPSDCPRTQLDCQDDSNKAQRF